MSDEEIEQAALDAAFKCLFCEEPFVTMGELEDHVTFCHPVRQNRV